MVIVHFLPTDVLFISAVKEEAGLGEGTSTKSRCSLILPGATPRTSAIPSIRLTMMTHLLFTLTDARFFSVPRVRRAWAGTMCFALSFALIQRLEKLLIWDILSTPPLMIFILYCQQMQKGVIIAA